MMRVSDILHSTGAVLLRGDGARTVHGVSTDTRALRPHQLAWAEHLIRGGVPFAVAHVVDDM